VNSAPSLDALRAAFEAAGGTEADYLQQHYPRMAATWSAYVAGPRGDRRGRLLDVGSHWLHQALIWRLQGFEVTAVDVAATVAEPRVRRLASAHGITLHENPSLEHPEGLAGLPDDGYDLILMTEVIEHLAFNPLPLWRQLYRLLAPGGAIVLTTPNYYALRGRAWQWRRFLTGRGGGLSVREILTIPSFGHHWREFALAELRDYVALLSPDLRIERALRLPRDYRHRRLGALPALVERLLPPLRDQLYLEIGLPAKQRGITATASW
jgi:SAM-dependent methyltransferase